jgi:hypothetical protein
MHQRPFFVLCRPAAFHNIQPRTGSCEASRGGPTTIRYYLRECPLPDKSGPSATEAQQEIDLSSYLVDTGAAGQVRRSIRGQEGFGEGQPVLCLGGQAPREERPGWVPLHFPYTKTFIASLHFYHFTSSQATRLPVAACPSFLIGLGFRVPVWSHFCLPALVQSSWEIQEAVATERALPAFSSTYPTAIGLLYLSICVLCSFALRQGLELNATGRPLLL